MTSFQVIFKTFSEKAKVRIITWKCIASADLGPRLDIRLSTQQFWVRIKDGYLNAFVAVVLLHKQNHTFLALFYYEHCCKFANLMGRIILPLFVCLRECKVLQNFIHIINLLTPLLSSCRKYLLTFCIKKTIDSLFRISICK